MGERVRKRGSENSNVTVARKVYMYMLLIGALAWMSTSSFSFDVMTKKGASWGSIVLFWLTLAMFGGAYYLYDRSRRDRVLFSVVMTGIFVVAVAYPFYTISDPRMLVVRVATGIVVLVAVSHLLDSLSKASKASKRKVSSDSVEVRPRNRRVNNFGRFGGALVPNAKDVEDVGGDVGVEDGFQMRRDPEVSERGLTERELTDVEMLLLQFALDDVEMKEREVSLFSDRMSRVRERRSRMRRKTYIRVGVQDSVENEDKE